MVKVTFEEAARGVRKVGNLTLGFLLNFNFIEGREYQRDRQLCEVSRHGMRTGLQEGENLEIFINQKGNAIGNFKIIFHLFGIKLYKDGILNLAISRFPVLTATEPG